MVLFEDFYSGNTYKRKATFQYSSYSSMTGSGVHKSPQEAQFHGPYQIQFICKGLSIKYIHICQRGQVVSKSSTISGHQSAINNDFLQHLQLSGK